METQGATIRPDHTAGLQPGQTPRGSVLLAVPHEVAVRYPPPHSPGCGPLFWAEHIRPALCQASGPPGAGPRPETCLRLPIAHT